MAMQGCLDKRAKGATNEHLRKIYNNTNHQAGGAPIRRRRLVKKHNCLNAEAKSEASLTGSSSRPSTRRNPNVTPKQPISRPVSTSKSERMLKSRQKRSDNSSNNDLVPPNVDLQLNLPEQNLESNALLTPGSQKSVTSKSASPKTEPSARNELSFDPSSGDHEYLLFLLRITEDIISNDFYSNGDIKKIFKTHMELNKDRLNMRKMHFHISNLCKELNIECKEFQTPEFPDDTDPPNKFQNCPEGHKFVLSNDSFKNCPDCSTIRSSGSFCELKNALDIGDSASRSTISPSLMKLLEKLSLGRVTERTEPVPSTSTIGSLNSPEKDFDSFIKELRSEPELPEDLTRLEDFPEPLIECDENDVKMLKDPYLDTFTDESKTTLDIFEKDSNTEKSELDMGSSDTIVTVRDQTEKQSEEIDREKLELFEAKKAPLTSPQSLTTTTASKEKDIKATISAPSFQSNHLVYSEIEHVEQINNDKLDFVKVQLEGPIKDEDFVMIKGPIFVYKALLDCEPKLIIFPEIPTESRPDSADSRKTFTVERTDRAVQIDPDLRSLEIDPSMEHILELTRAAFGQMKLLNSDYDLTPEKDSSDKYHHLLVDASTSVSVLDGTEELLLNDDYAMIDQPNGTTAKLYENDYVMHRKSGLSSSSSTSKLKFGRQRTEERPLKRCSSDLIRFDLPSQDSSLISEGEAVHKFHYSKINRC